MPYTPEKTLNTIEDKNMIILKKINKRNSVCTEMKRASCICTEIFWYVTALLSANHYATVDRGRFSK